MSTKRIRKRCCIGGCLNTDINTVSLHRVPEDTRSPGIKEKWCSIIRKSKGKPAWEPLKNSVVCGHHFTWKDFHGKRDQGFVKTSLRKEAVPSRKLGPLITPVPSPPPEEEELASAMEMDSTDFSASAPSTSQRASLFSGGPGGIMSPDDINKNLFKLQRQLNQVIENKKFNELVDPDEPYFSEFDEESFPDFDLGCEEEIGEVDSDDEFEGEIFDEEKLYMDESELQPSLMLEVEVDDERRTEAEAVRDLSPSPPPAPKPRYPCPSCPKTFLRPDHLELHQIIHAADKDRNNAHAGPSKKPKLDTEDPPALAVVSETTETVFAQGSSSTDVNGQKPVKPREWPKRFLSLPPSNNILSTSSLLAKAKPIPIMPAPTKPRPILAASVTPIVPTTPAIKPKPKLPPPLIPISSVPRFQGRTEVVQIKEQKNEDKEEAGRKYQCRFCPKRFSRTDHLQQHLTIHTGSRPYKCHMCPKAFPIIVTLKRHLKTHIGAKEFPCTKCPRKFTQIGHLKRHMDSPFTPTTAASGSANQEQENTEDQEEDDEQEEEAVEVEQEQQCKFCGEIVLGLRALLHHYQQNHYQKSVQEQLVGDGEDEEPEVDPAFVCRLCNESFVSREERFSHEILIHKIKNPNARLECKYCKKVICTFNGLAKHIRRHEEGRGGGNNGNRIVETEPEQVREQEEADEQEDSDGAGAEAGDVVTPASDVTLWTCRLCPQVFLEQLERLVHENSVHNTKDSTQIHVCKHCSKEIATFRV